MGTKNTSFIERFFNICVPAGGQPQPDGPFCHGIFLGLHGNQPGNDLPGLFACSGCDLLVDQALSEQFGGFHID